MAVTVSGKNIEMGDSLRDFVVAEIEKASQQFLGSFIDAHAVLDKENGLFSCELAIHIARGFSLRSTGQDPDPYSAVTQAFSILRQRTRRYKARLRSAERRHKPEAQGALLARYVIGEVQEEENVQENPVVIAEMPDALVEMSVGDAVMRLDLSEVPVVVFKNESTGQINVVYRRMDRNVGWIAPKLG